MVVQKAAFIHVPNSSTVIGKLVTSVVTSTACHDVPNRSINVGKAITSTVIVTACHDVPNGSTIIGNMVTRSGTLETWDTMTTICHHWDGRLFAGIVTTAATVFVDASRKPGARFEPHTAQVIDATGKIMGFQVF